MARPSSPWFRKIKNTWYCTLDGKKVSLKVRGEGNEREAIKAWHRLFAGMPLESPEMPLQSHEICRVVPETVLSAIISQSVPIE